METYPHPKVPLVDLAPSYKLLRKSMLEAIDAVAASTAFSQGPAAAQFEAAFAEYCNVKHCVSVNSGTSALHAALICLGVGAGDEVITSPLTFISTAWAISYVGAKPVFVDIDPKSRTLDVRMLESVINSRTKVVLPVHLYGQPADMDAICNVAQSRGIAVVEDAAQAHGARYKSRRVGGLGAVGCFSFYPGKNLGAYGEGGAITTNDDSIAEHAKSLRNHGQKKRYYHDEIGFNYRMDSLQGAVLLQKLSHLDEWNAARSSRAKRYSQALRGLPIGLPQEFSHSQSSWHLYVIECEKRDALRLHLERAGIETGIHYPVPVHLQPAYSHLQLKRGCFPESESLAERCLSLPMYPELTDALQDRVIKEVGRFFL